MMKPYLTIVLLLICWGPLWANPDPTDPDSTKITMVTEELPEEIRTELYRTFEGLSIDGSGFTHDPIQLPTVADSTEEKRIYAQNLLEKVQNGQRFLETLDALSEVELPIGVVKTGGGVDYSILIDRINFTTQGAIMEVYASLALPSGHRIAFNGKVPLSHEGGIAGSAKIFLVGDHHINLGKSLLIIKGSQNTYVEFDCNGFVGISLESEVQFSRELIVPENEDGIVIENDERVKVSFTIYAQSLNDLMVGVTFPPFQVAGLKGVGFSISNAYMDWSDLANPPGIVFPEGYESPYVAGGAPLLWQGFYMKSLEVRLPPGFTKNREDGSRVKLGVENMILDDMGFTGKVFAENVIQAGDMNGWSYSLDRVGIELVSNQIKGFDLGGRLTIPVVKDKEGKPTQFGYTAQRGSDGNYIFAVEIQSSLKLDLWAANINLYPGSGVTVKEKNNKFYPSATLNGDISIGASGKGPEAKFTGIKFERMVISTEAPHFSIGAVGFGREGNNSSASGFPLAINNIMIRSEGNKIGLGMDITINIGGSAEEEGFGGTGALIVWGEREQVTSVNAQGGVSTTQGDWKFDKVELTGIGVRISKPGVIELEGMIRFFDDDPTYGDGFKGSLSGKIQAIGVKAEALFGKTPTFRYWYADALVEIKSGVPIVPGVLSAYGFGGGFYSKMKQSSQKVVSGLGESPSGITYVPDENTFGIRAIVMIGAARPEAWNGDVSLEVSLNRHGGINSVTFTGNANFMSPASIAGDKIKELASSAVANKLAEKLAALIRGQVYGSVKLHFDNVNDVFHGNLEIYVNVAGGLVRGVSDGNKAGWAVIHFERNDWYILIGTPDQPIGLEVARMFKARSYFMLGKNLPGSPPPPKQVSEILGGVNLDYMRDLNALQSGTGFAFGLHFGVDTGDLTFLIFYARLSAGTGIDFMLKDYGENCVCEGSSDPIGIRGWYANGQAYAYVQGSIGIKVNLRFIKGKYEILAIGAAAVLQAKGPNPFWMQGIVGGYYRILGGLVKGNCKFQMTIGKDCKIVPNPALAMKDPLEDVNIISELSPASESNEVDVFTAPQAAFNIPMNEVFSIDEPVTGTRRLFRGTVESFKVTHGGNTLVGELQWNDTKDVVAFNPFDILPPQKTIKVSVKVIFEEYVNGNWQAMYFDGKRSEETKETTFTTGEAPDFIPPSNIDISYPAVGQFNFYPREFNEGYIILKQGQGYLFKTGDEWIQKIHFADATTHAYLETDVSYIESEKKVHFKIPSGLQNNQAYRIHILSIPRQNQLVDANIKQVEKTITPVDGGDITVSTKAIEGNLEIKEIKTLYASLFRTSGFNTFKEKLNTISLSSTFRQTVNTNVFQLIAYMQGNELFDDAEINGHMADRLIQFEAVLDQNSWFQNHVRPLVYDGFPLLSNMTIRYRNINELGFPPVKSTYIYQAGYAPRLTEQDLSASFQLISDFNSIHYDVMVPARLDYLDIQNQVANYVVDNPSGSTPRFSKLLTTPFPVYRYGKYRVKINYVIPRINKTTSTHEWELFNTIPD